jgi:antitoxin VapB
MHPPEPPGSTSGLASTMKGRMTAVPTLNIKDPEVYRLAAELARRRGTTMTGAVRQALAEALDDSTGSREGIAERLMEIARRSAAKDAPFLTDDDLYDERGLPR